eukprot:TRINITY_DN3396_c0_g1_i1.p1 TRINITY_DN3396_c0_g1~~TRINITY_DN3396_c0_g1_i1.p1  ORF type:complete len:469 (-),score=154.10 TRINITY_DN3396_c0_g1_i1:132-1538(-)
MTKVPSVSIVGAGKNRSGFLPLPDTDSPALAAAKKSRAEKNRTLLKIGAVVVVLSAVLAGLTAFLLTRGSKEDLSEFYINRDSLVMSDKIVHVEEVRSVASSNEQFSVKLYDLLRKKEGNLIMSPFSVSGVMAMVSAGAGGNTLDQIRDGLSFPSSSSLQLGYQDAIPALRSTDNFTLEAANTVFAMKDFSVLAEFQELLHRSFHASIQSVDFGDNQLAARMINNWVEKMTRDKIKHLIKKDMLSALTRLVLVNAIYFKGDWASKFDPKLTKEQDFSVSPSTTVKASMMMQEKKLNWAYLETLGSSMVELPYKGDRIVMQVLLPGERHGLGELEEKLKNENIQNLFAKESYETKVNIQLPKFKLEQSIPLTEHLTDLGMKDMFSEGLADFSGIDGSKQLYVSNVIQKAFIEVNEEGSEAAAATGAVMMMRSMPAPPEQFVADHPFIFYLRDKTTGMLLFQGRVVNPTE